MGGSLDLRGHSENVCGYFMVSQWLSSTTARDVRHPAEYEQTEMTKNDPISFATFDNPIIICVDEKTL